LVLVAPPLYQYYLWRKGKTNAAGLWRSARLFAPLYALVFGALFLLLTKA
jgi:hypothetical protein